MVRQADRLVIVFCGIPIWLDSRTQQYVDLFRNVCPAHNIVRLIKLWYNIPTREWYARFLSRQLHILAPDAETIQTLRSLVPLFQQVRTVPRSEQEKEDILAHLTAEVMPFLDNLNGLDRQRALDYLPYALPRRVEIGIAEPDQGRRDAI